MPDTFVRDLEKIVAEVSDWGADIVNEVVKTLAPDGVGYGQEHLTEEQQLDQYRKIRNDVNGWTAWIQDRAVEIQNTLTNSGVTPQTLGAINPTSIATAMMLDYSSKMEAKLNKRMIV